MTYCRTLLATCLLGLSLNAVSEDVRLEDLPEPPPPPPEPLSSGEALEPEVTIRQQDDAEVEEYRLNGHLFMIKVKPVVGPAYYLRDNDGDGQLETRMSELYSDMIVPQWIILSWD